MLVVEVCGEPAVKFAGNAIVFGMYFGFGFGMCGVFEVEAEEICGNVLEKYFVVLVIQV